MTLPRRSPSDPSDQLPPVARIRPSAWCLARLAAVAPGLLTAPRDVGPPRRLPVLCVAAHDDVVLVVRERADETWSLVWSEVTVDVSGTGEDGERFTIRARGTCERERLPVWAVTAWARASHPAGGGAAPPPPPIGLRLRAAALRGYSVAVPEPAAG